MEIVLDNIKVNYIIKGENNDSTVLILHGWGVDHNTYTNMIDNLALKNKVYAIDFPGFGKSQNPPSNYDVTAYAKLTLEFIEKLKLGTVTLIGHSFGGRVIIKLVGALGYKPKRIILVDSAGIKPKRPLKYKVKQVVYKVLKNIARVFLGKRKYESLMNKYREKVGSADYNRADETMKEVFKNVVNEDLREHLKSINAPTLLIWGNADTETPVSDAKIMESEIPDAGLVVLNGGHFSFLDNPIQFINIVNKFMEG